MKTFHFASSLLAAGLYHTASGQSFGAVTNIAVDGQASQSSVCGGSAARAIDGDITGYWKGDSVARTCAKRQSWWKVDLKTDDAELENLCIWNRKDTGENRKTLNGSSLLVMDKDGAILFDDKIKFDTTTGKLCFDVSNINSAKTVMIKRQKVSRKPLEIAEVKINGRYRITDAPSLSPSISALPTNGGYTPLYDMAPSGEVEMSCAFNENIGKRANDGLMNTFAHTCTEQKSYISLKLDQNDAVIRKIVLWPRDTEVGRRSLNGAELRVINKNGGIESSQIIESKAWDEKLVFEFDPDSVIGKTIKIRRKGTKTKPLQLTEIEVWGKTLL
jgi:hypothetical protein